MSLNISKIEILLKKFTPLFPSNPTLRSGATEHSKECHGPFNWLHPKTLAKLFNIRERKIRVSLEINNLETKAEYDKSIKVLNRDRGNIVNTNSWKPLFRKINMVVRHANAME